MRTILAALPLLLVLPAGCQRSARPAASPDSGAPAAPRPSVPVDAQERLDAPPKLDADSCVDAWLSKRNLDPYGHPEGTMYAGGTPLFDERTGVATDRLTYVLARHPELASACPAAARADAGSSAAPADR